MGKTYPTPLRGNDEGNVSTAYPLNKSLVRSRKPPRSMKRPHSCSADLGSGGPGRAARRFVR